ncbi:hypothetical protein [Streptomyces chryseus]
MTSSAPLVTAAAALTGARSAPGRASARTPDRLTQRAHGPRPPHDAKQDRHPPVRQRSRETLP